jgi:hypothetical protein
MPDLETQQRQIQKLPAGDTKLDEHGHEAGPDIGKKGAPTYSILSARRGQN